MSPYAWKYGMFQNGIGDEKQLASLSWIEPCMILSYLKVTSEALQIS